MAQTSYSNVYDDAYDQTTPPPPPPPPGGGFVGGTSTLTILARNSDLTFAGELEYERVELVPRYNAVGSWTVDIGFDSLDSTAAALLLPGAGIVAVVNDQIIMSGPVTKPVRQRDGDLNHLTIAGVDDLVHVEDRVAHQDPTRADNLQPDNTYSFAEDANEGPAEQVITHYVNFNAGQAAILARQVPGLTVAVSQGRGLTVEETGRMQNLLELIAKLGKAGAVGFRCVQTGPGVLTFSVYEPLDKSAAVVFAVGLGNLAAYEYSAERPTTNAPYIGGKGEGAARVFRLMTDAASIIQWGRIESFVEDSSSKQTKLGQVGRGELISGAARHFFSANAIDTGMHQWAPFATSPMVQTYDLGDIVSVVADQQRITEVIRELRVVDSPEGLTVTPIIGSADQGGRREERFYQSLMTEIRRLRIQVRDLQRR